MNVIVGNIVYYKSYGSANGEYMPENRAAIVTAVNTDETIDICVLNPTGTFFNQKVSHGTGGGQWDFMPSNREQHRLPESNMMPTDVFLANHYKELGKEDEDNGGK